MIKLLSGSTWYQSYRRAYHTISDILFPGNKFLTIKISLKAQHPVEIILSTSAVIHSVSGPHIQNYFLNVISLASPAQHTYPQIIILKPREIPVTACTKNRFPAEHNTRMIKRISFFGISQDLLGSSWQDPQPVHISRLFGKFLQSTTYQVISVSFYNTKLSFTAIRSADIIAVHSGYHRTTAFWNAYT